jgi:hypothetical protein
MRTRLIQTNCIVLLILVLQLLTSPSAAAVIVSAPALNPLTGTQTYLWSVIGNTGEHLAAERTIGIQAKVFRFSWRNFAPTETTISQSYVTRKLTELADLRQAGFKVILDLGFHDTPAWIHQNYPDSRYVNQYGDAYSANGEIDSGDANLVFNPALRQAAATYIQAVFATLGTDFVAVRLGGGRWGELTYPPATYASHSNVYWGFDAGAQSQSLVPGWVPGQAAPQGQDRIFLAWYHDALVDFQNWQITTVRQSYAGALMMLYPSWGIRPGQIDLALATHLNGSTSAEINGEIQRGFDFARQIAAITDPNVIVTTTWLDADMSADSRNDPRYWSPVKYLASLANAHPLGLRLYGENTGQGSAATMEMTAGQMHRYSLLGMAWYREEEFFTGTYATLTDYQTVIATFSPLPGNASRHDVFLPLLLNS